MLHGELQVSSNQCYKTLMLSGTASAKNHYFWVQFQINGARNPTA